MEIAFFSPEALVCSGVVDGFISVDRRRCSGTGKSRVLRAIISALQQRVYPFCSGAVAVTASTGMFSFILRHCYPFDLLAGSAACDIGGVTLHSFAGVGLGVDSSKILLRKIRRDAAALMRWRRVRVLVIDEGKVTGSFTRPINEGLSVHVGRRAFR